MDATASGLNTGISDAIYAFPMTFGHYFFRADFAHQWDATPFAPINNAGVAGQVEISYNHIEKPEYVRWMPWHPNTFVSKGTQWYPRTGGSWMLSIKTPGTTGPTEPAYCYAVNCEVTDGTAVWIMMLANTSTRSRTPPAHPTWPEPMPKRLQEIQSGRLKSPARREKAVCLEVVLMGR